MGSSKPRCPHCGVYVKPENLPNHLRNVHRDEAGADSEAANVRASAPTRPRAARSAPAPVGRGTWAAIGLVLLVILAGGAVLRWGGVGGSPYNSTTPVTEMCIEHSSLVGHIHAHLNVTILGNPQPIGANIGIAPGCMRPLHTHDGSGWIHIESPVPHVFTLGDFFTVWGQPFSSTEILSYQSDSTHVVTMSVNGTPSQQFRALTLTDQMYIDIQYTQV